MVPLTDVLVWLENYRQCAVWQLCILVHLNATPSDLSSENTRYRAYHTLDVLLTDTGRLTGMTTRGFESSSKSKRIIFGWARFNTFAPYTARRCLRDQMLAGLKSVHFPPAHLQLDADQVAVTLVACHMYYNTTLTHR